jgi:hypothetical protein
MACGITNLGSCLVESFFEFLVYVMNLPVRPLLALINNLLIEPVSISIFAELWAIIVYMLSLFYGIFLVVIGIQMIVSGHSVEQREKAKQSLTNILIMIVLVQASFLIYELAIEVASALTATIFGMIDPSFFQITINNPSNIGLEIALLIPYLLALLTTVAFLAVRYLFVSMGVVFCAIGIFCYFIGPISSYGKLILNYLGMLIAIPVIYSIIFLASSQLLNIQIFYELKIVAMIGSLVLINLVTVTLVLFVIIKAAMTLAGPTKVITQIATGGI